MSTAFSEPGETCALPHHRQLDDLHGGDSAGRSARWPRCVRRIQATYVDIATIGWFAAIVFALAAFVAAIPAWFRRWTTEIAVTDRRIILKRGLIRRHTVEMNMQKLWKGRFDVDQIA